MADDLYDLLIIGGGINGAGIARDAAGQGLRLLLCEQGDLASATSSASSKLVHGGLRYLEQGEFWLVRKALREREVLLRLAPHIVWPLRFVLPHDRRLRPAWMIRLGLFLYDNLAGRRRLGGSRSLNLRRAPEGEPLKDAYKKGFLYSDCWVDDARLVILNCVDAAERGAEIRPRTKVVSAKRIDGVWEARLFGDMTGLVRARALVNAAGPWVDDVQQDIMGIDRPDRLRLVKGSHIVVDRLYDGDQAYILQNDDGRIVFAIPYEGRFTLIGTTEMLHEREPGDAAPDETEIDYLSALANRYFERQTGREWVRWSYAGVRPLFDDGSVTALAVTRDYVFDLDAPQGGEPEDAAPALSIYGGKITTYRLLAEHALSKLLPVLGVEPKAWTETAPLPGGDFPDGDFIAFLADLRARYPFLPDELSHRYARLYGTRAAQFLGTAASLSDLGKDLGGGLYEAEAAYLREHEWAETDEDILWRRTKLGLHQPGVQSSS